MKEICGSCFSEKMQEQGICPVCGFDSRWSDEIYPQALPIGTILYGRYIVGKVLGQGGFGITYLAQDYQTKKLVAIKEFYPDTMVTRTGHTNVMPYAGERGEHFAYGKDSFLNEAKTMAQFIGNAGIVQVHSYFEENNTGYFVMEYVEGSNLQDYVRKSYGRLSWQEAIRIMIPILDALSAVHKKGIIHRDVTPDNIYIIKDGSTKLLDFGAARHSLGNVSRSLDVVLKHGFAPKEQYHRRGRQGPYTDIYSAAATIYYVLTGTRPDDAIERLEEDSTPLPSTLGAIVTAEQEDVLLKGMAVQAEERYQTMTEFRDALLAVTPAEPVPVREPESAVVPEPLVEPESAVVPEPVAETEPAVVPEPVEELKPVGIPEPMPPLKKKKTGLIAAICIGVLLCAGAGFWLLHPHSYGEWQAIKEATCTSEGEQMRKCFCGNTQTRQTAALSHTVVSDPAVSATCETAGLTEGSHCSACGAILIEQVATPLIDHEIIHLDAVPASCETNGLTEGMGCSVCGYVEVPQEVVEAFGHTPVTDAAVASTCTEEGKTEGSHCSVCGTVLKAQQTAAKTSHTPVKDAAVTATCTEAGKTEGSHCSVCGTVIEAQTVTSAALGHSFSENKCSRCGCMEWYAVVTCSNVNPNEGEMIVFYVTIYTNNPGKTTGLYINHSCTNEGDIWVDGVHGNGASFEFSVYAHCSYYYSGEDFFNVYTADGYYMGGTTMNVTCTIEHEW